MATCASTVLPRTDHTRGTAAETSGGITDCLRDVDPPDTPSPSVVVGSDIVLVDQVVVCRFAKYTVRPSVIVPLPKPLVFKIAVVRSLFDSPSATSPFLPAPPPVPPSCNSASALRNNALTSESSVRPGGGGGRRSIGRSECRSRILRGSTRSGSWQLV